MKRISLIVCSIVLSTITYAQNLSSNNEHILNYTTRTIEVVGSAFVELEPDQVFVSLTLKDYYSNGKITLMKKIVLALSFIITGITANAQYTQQGKIEYERKINVKRMIDDLDDEQKQWMEK